MKDFKSPFRYPGGKSWMASYVRAWIKQQPSRPALYIEPFAGGGHAGLQVASNNLAGRVIFVEKDDKVASVWQAILTGDADWLAERVVTFEMTVKAVEAVLRSAPETLEEKAFKTILENRVDWNGLLTGRTGTSRRIYDYHLRVNWYPEVIGRRIRNIRDCADRITFIHGDAFDIIEQYKGRPDAVWYFDPPYVLTGKEFYNHNVIDHLRLLGLANALAGDFLIALDINATVTQLVEEHALEMREVVVKNCRNNKKPEVIIGRDLSWMSRM